MAKDVAEPTPAVANSQVIGGRVKKARQAKEMTQFALAHAAGTDTSTIHRIESGKQAASVAKLAGIAEALGLTLDELVKP